MNRVYPHRCQRVSQRAHFLCISRTLNLLAALLAACLLPPVDGGAAGGESAPAVQFRTPQTYEGGRQTAVASHPSGTDNLLNCITGTIADAQSPQFPAVAFTPYTVLDTGAQPSVAVDSSGLVVEFHKTQNVLGNSVWYHLGRLKGADVTWGPSRYASFDGFWPDVAITTEGYILAVFSDQSYKVGSDLIYKVGRIDPAQDQNQGIIWLSPAAYWDAGFHSSIAINENGVIVGVHEAGRGGDGIYYRVGHFANPAGGDFTIQWDSGPWGIRYDTGINPQIAINNRNEIVAVHQVPGESLLHYRRGIVSGGVIHFGESMRYDEHATEPAIALLDSGLVLEVACSDSGLSTRTGVLSAANPWEIRWSEPGTMAPDDDLEYPALTAHGTGAVAIFEGGLLGQVVDVAVATIAP